MTTVTNGVNVQAHQLASVAADWSFMDMACRAFDWIASVAVGVDGGLGWLEGGVLCDDLYSGTAGVLLGCAEAAAAGLKSSDQSFGRGLITQRARPRTRGPATAAPQGVRTGDQRV